MNSIARKMTLLTVAAALLAVPASEAFAAPKGPRINVDSRALLRPALAGGKEGYVDVYAQNDGDENVAGTITIKSGGKTLWKQSVDIDWGDNDYWGNLRLRGKPLRTLRRKGKLKATSIATWKDSAGKTVTVKKPLKVVAGGPTRAFDGYYKGPGPVVLRVDRGVLRSIDTNLNLFCPRSNTFQMRTFLGDDGFPVLIGRNGSFARKGSFAGDTVNYHGKLTRKGTGKGYLSLFHTNLSVSSEGRLVADQCYQAKNWTVTRR